MHKEGQLKILLISPNFFSGIGNLGRHIADSATDIDFYFFSNADIKKHKSEFLRLVRSVDVVHWLASLPWVKLPTDIDIHEFQSPNIGSIFHFDETLTGERRNKENLKIKYASKCTGIHVMSSEWQSFFQSKTDTPVHLAHPALNLKRFIPNRKINRPRIPIRIGTFGFVREISDRKRLDVLLDALEILIRTGYKFELIVQGPLWKALEKDFFNQDIHVTNLGFTPSFMAMKSYQYIDMYICTSDIEGGPLTVLEALASGIPVVSTPVGVAADALALGGGILVQKDNSREVAAAIARIIDDPDLYQRLSHEAIETSQNFSWECISKEYKAMYVAVLEGKTTTSEPENYPLSPKLQRDLQLFRDFIRRERFLLKGNFKERKLLKTLLGLKY